MPPPTAGPSLTVRHPRPAAEFPAGADISVNGTAEGTGGAEPHPIDSVTVAVDSAPPVEATLTSAPHPSLVVTFQATVRLAAPGGHRIVVTASDDLGRSARETIPVTSPGSTHCQGGVEWANYPRTQSVIPFATCTPQTLAGVVAIVREAEAAQRRVHACGSRWSFSDCAVTGDYLIDTRRLYRPLQTVQGALRPGPSPRLFHVEAGITIWNLYTELSRLGLALETMGGASGQTLAGAVSTGTHGGDKFMAPLADSVLAVHLVGPGGTQFWIEPAAGITDPALLRARVVPEVDPANIVYDDAVFDASLVSLGCMGVIYAVVLRVREAYDLVETTTTTTWREFQAAAPTHLSDRANRFLQVVVSPYRDGNGDNLCFVTTRSEAAPTGPVDRPRGDVEAAVRRMVDDLDFFAKLTLQHQGVFDEDGLSAEERLARIIQGILVYTPDQRHVLVDHYGNLMAALWPAGTFQGASYSVMDIGYGQPLAGSQPGYSVELFFPALDANGRLGFADFVDVVIGIVNAATETFFAGYVSLRFTGPTRASLGMQQWAQTCAVEISVVQGVQGELALMTRLFQAGIERGGVPHWGQLLDLGMQGHGSLYPRYPRWRQAYARMSSGFAVRTFENALSSRWNLTSPDDAQFVSQTVSVAMTAGQSQSVSVTMRNTGVSTWTSAGSFSLGAQDPPDNAVWGPSRRAVPAEVPPGATVTFQFDILAPATPGAYPFRWRMVQQGGWFGQLTPGMAIGVDPPAGRTLVPDVIESSSADAAAMVRDAGLQPAFTGATGADAWVDSQSPGAGTVVSRGSTVTLHLRTGPLP